METPIKKAKTHKGRMHLNSLQPKIIEDPKECLFINTDNSSEIMKMVLGDLYLMRKAYSKKLGQKNRFENVFKDQQSIEFFCDRNNTPIFTYTSDGKKKPMNLVIGSLFNKKVLDMVEFEVTNFIPLSHFAKEIKINSDMKPVIIFQGDLFETDFQFERIRKFFLDYLRLHDLDEVSIEDLRRVIIISVADNKEIKLRCYQVEGPIKEFTLNDLNLTEIGPSIDLKLRNIHLASKELYDLSLKQPKEAMLKKVKNIEKNALGEKRGRIHMTKQNLKAAALKNYKKILTRKRFGKENPEIEGGEKKVKKGTKRVAAGGKDSKKKRNDESKEEFDR
jgi:ribosome production factor 2